MFDTGSGGAASQQPARRLDLDSHSRSLAVILDDAGRAIAADPYAADQFQPLIDCIVSGGLPVRASPGSLRYRCSKPFVGHVYGVATVLGSGCLEDSDCMHFPNQTGLTCDQGTKTCTAQRASLGEACAGDADLPLSQVCADGLYCDGAPSNGSRPAYKGTCKKRLTAGSVCPMADGENVAYACAAGTTCVMSYPATEQTGHCRPLGSLPVGTQRTVEVNTIVECLDDAFDADPMCETGYTSCQQDSNSTKWYSVCANYPPGDAGTGAGVCDPFDAQEVTDAILHGKACVCSASSSHAGILVSRYAPYSIAEYTQQVQQASQCLVKVQGKECPLQPTEDLIQLSLAPPMPLQSDCYSTRCYSELLDVAVMVGRMQASWYSMRTSQRSWIHYAAPLWAPFTQSYSFGPKVWSILNSSVDVLENQKCFEVPGSKLKCPSSPGPGPSNHPGGSPLSTGEIAGIAAGCLVVVAIAGAAFFYNRSRRQDDDDLGVTAPLQDQLASDKSEALYQNMEGGGRPGFD